MRRIVYVLGSVYWCQFVMAQQPLKKTIKNELADSIAAVRWREEHGDELPAVAVNEDDRVTAIPSPLMASRNVLMNFAGFHFSMARFRFRGYDGGASVTELNGIPMNDPENGNTAWNLWSGLTEVTKNAQSYAGISANDLSFGDIGNTTFIDTRASKQRVQTQAGYALSNRSFTHRFSFVHSAGMNKRNWAYSVSGSWRYASEGAVPGTFLTAGSYFIAVDKKINARQMLSFNLFGAPSEAGKQGAVTAEMVELAGSAHYNGYWGYQSGKKRNANVRSMHLPVIILRHDWQIDNHTRWMIAAGYIGGRRTDTGLDWYKAADPRPDYYRYLPSYQYDPALRLLLTNAIHNNPLLLQVNWNHLIDINRHSFEKVVDANGIKGKDVYGLRSHYIVEDRIVATKRFVLNSVYHSMPADNTSFSAGASLQVEETHAYKKINDLLGGEFYVDWNQFAEEDFPHDAAAMQNDLNYPNRVLHRQDVFGYNYRVHSLLAKGWMQYSFTGSQWDHFEAVEISYHHYQREGLVRNGLFPVHSYGRSFLYEFTGYAAKAGITYKINGRKYLYAAAGFFSKPPLFDHVFISPKTNHAVQENVRHEKILSVEAGYLCNAPGVRLRLSGFYTLFTDGMHISTFYHDGYGNFVNYAISGINKVHAGVELGAEFILSEHLTMNLAASAGNYYYNGRQMATVTADNSAVVIDREMIYAKNFRTEGGPQETYGGGINYQSSRFYAGVTASCFRQQWIAFNPLRRTYAAVKDLVPGTDTWNKVLQQLVLPDQYTVDISGGTSFRLGTGHRQHIVSVYLGINNVLNNHRFISGGYEQLRFDAATKSTDKFPPKFFYAMGLNYSLNLSLRL